MSRFEAERQHAVAALDRALSGKPAEEKETVDVAERAVVHLRDALIEQLRNQSESSVDPTCRQKLDQVNMAISLIGGVEYPAEGPQRKPLEQAREVLQSLKGA